MRKEERGKRKREGGREGGREDLIFETRENICCPREMGSLEAIQSL